VREVVVRWPGGARQASVSGVRIRTVQHALRLRG
jgi:hypothetical protein